MSSLLYCRPSDIVTPAATLSLTAGGANAAYPLTNLQNGIPAKPFKATGTSCTIRATFGSPVSLSAISFGPHNLAGATVALSNNGTMGSTPVPIPANREDGLSVNPFFAFPADAATQWNLAISGASANVAIGELQLIVQMRTLLIEWAFKEAEAHTTVGSVTDYGVKMKYWLGVAQRRLSAHVGLESERAALLSLIRDARGQFKSFLLVPDSSLNDAFLADLTTDERVITREFFAVSQVDVEFLEVQRGVAL